ncbi:CD1108 family mobile element protein [Ethanoligenens sp.]|uniref:CD1108 family mobile element protein n=1 Tax=Ethanoligenens sp. TaxID=2099655 RepID=UPI0039E8BB11
MDKQHSSHSNPNRERFRSQNQAPSYPQLEEHGRMPVYGHSPPSASGGAGIWRRNRPSDTPADKARTNGHQASNTSPRGRLPSRNPAPLKTADAVNPYKSNEYNPYRSNTQKPNTPRPKPTRQPSSRKVGAYTPEGSLQGGMYTRTHKWNDQKRDAPTQTGGEEPPAFIHKPPYWETGPAKAPASPSANMLLRHISSGGRARGGSKKAPGGSTPFSSNTGARQRSPVSRSMRKTPAHTFRTAAAAAASAVHRANKEGPVQGASAEAAGTVKNAAVLAAKEATRRMVRQIRRRQTEKVLTGSASKVFKRILQALIPTKQSMAIVGAVIAVVLLLFLLISTTLLPVFAGIAGAAGGVESITFAASDADIDQADRYYSQREADLRTQIANIQSTHPGYNEYDYAVGTIGHVPLQLIAYLTAVYGDFSFTSVKPHLDELFNMQYQLHLTAQTQMRTVTTTDPSTGQPTTTQQPYTILTVNLNAQDFTSLLAILLAQDGLADEYAALMQAKGNRQYFSNPFSFGWSMYITGLSAANVVVLDVPVGTQVNASIAGTVTQVAGGTVQITGTDGLAAVYTNCASVKVSQGQAVAANTPVATTGSGFSVQFLHNGEDLDPYIFVDIGEDASTTSGSITVGGNPIGGSVGAYTGTVTQMAAQYGMSAYVNLILAVMQQESGGQGGDPMQAAEGPFNTEYPKCPNGITNPTYSIQCGIQELHQNLQLAGVTSPGDMPDIELALQGYNFGSGFISWAKKNGGYSLTTALAFSQMEALKMGWSSYGDPYYVPHVLRYYKNS